MFSLLTALFWAMPVLLLGGEKTAENPLENVLPDGHKGSSYEEGVSATCSSYALHEYLRRGCQSTLLSSIFYHLFLFICPCTVFLDSWYLLFPASDSQPYFLLFFCLFLEGPEIGEVIFRVCMKQLKSLQTLLEVKNFIAEKAELHEGLALYYCNAKDTMPS